MAAYKTSLFFRSSQVVVYKTLLFLKAQICKRSFKIFLKIWRFGPKNDFHSNLCDHPASLPAVNPLTELKLRLTSTLQNSERGRMVEETISNTVDKTVKDRIVFYN